jgi:hypothetical protein
MLETRDIGTAITRVALGIDRFERARQAAAGERGGESLVPIFIGDDLIEARAYGGWPEVDADLADLAASIEATPADARGVFLRGFLTSLKTVVRLFRGETLSFADKVRDLVGAPVGPVDPSIIAALTEALDAALARAGHAGRDLGARVAAWEAAGAIPPDQLEAVFSELLAKAKARTDALVFDTGDYDMALNPVRDAPYTARCGFVARRMDINVDQSFTRAALKHLVCHEVFPGHATQLLSTRAAVAAGRAPADALLCTADAITGCVQEGIGDQGVQLIDWIEDDDDEIHRLLRGLKSAVQTTAAWRLMADAEPREAVAGYLKTAGFGQDAWVAGRLRMSAHPFRGPFIASYWAGDASVRRLRERCHPDRRAELLTALYDHVQSPQSLELVGEALERPTGRSHAWERPSGPGEGTGWTANSASA